MSNQFLGYIFNNPLLLKQALTHPSLCARDDDSLSSYERLEFLGDSALNLIIAEFLMNKFPYEDEGKLAKRRAALVSGEMLTKIAMEINLGEQIRMTEAEERGGGRKNSNNLENVLEAIIGAIYLDSGLENLKAVIYNLWEKLIDEMVEVPIDAKSKLQEILQKNGYDLPKYELIESVGPKHMLNFRIRLKVPGFEEVIGQGKSKQQAEKEAASLLLLQMEQI